jgi:hypothetical protein
LKSETGVGGTTFRVALAVFPVPPFVELTAPDTLGYVPRGPVTFTEKVHEAPAASVAPVKLTLPDPAVAVMVPPPQLPVRPFGVATTRLPGKVSVKAMPLRERVFAAGLVTVKVRVVVLFGRIDTAPNAFPIEGGAATEMLAVAA